MVDPSTWADDRAAFAHIETFVRDTPWLHGFMRLFATYGVAVFAVLALVSWWIARQDRDARRVAASIWTPVAALVALAVNQPISSAVHEARPFTRPGLHTILLVHHSSDPGFTSDHATFAGAIAVGVLLVSWRLGLLTWLAALLLALSRVYVGAHFPVDVVAGLLLGSVVTLLGWALLGRVLTAAANGARRTPLHPLLVSASARRSDAYRPLSTARH